MAKFCTQTRYDHVQDTCWSYVSRGRLYENNDIFLNLRVCRPTLLLRQLVGRWVAGWLQPAGCNSVAAGCLAACWAAVVTWQACRYLISPFAGSGLLIYRPTANLQYPQRRRHASKLRRPHGIAKLYLQPTTTVETSLSCLAGCWND